MLPPVPSAVGRARIRDGADPQVLADAAQRLAAGGLVAFPTETVYGLGANADDASAVAGIYAAKGRPADHPLIVHVTDAAAVDAYAVDLPAVAQRLIEAFWPGPLTVILSRRAGVAEAAAAGLPTVGLRSPSHPVAQALLHAARKLGVRGVAAPSANRFGRISPTQALHVAGEFDADVEVLDGGACEVGIESAIVDCSRGYPVLLRPGQIGRARIEQAAGEPLRSPDADAPRSSGTLVSHYAPRARLRLMAGEQLRQALEVLGPTSAAFSRLALYSRTVAVPPGLRASRHMPEDADKAASELFAALRELDVEGVTLIWVESPPDAAAWDGVRDRLQRASA